MSKDIEVLGKEAGFKVEVFNKKKIESLLPHREPMLLIDKLTKILKMIKLRIQN